MATTEITTESPTEFELAAARVLELPSDKPIPKNQLVTARQAGAITGISTKTIQRYAKQSVDSPRRARLPGTRRYGIQLMIPLRTLEYLRKDPRGRGRPVGGGRRRSPVSEPAK